MWAELGGPLPHDYRLIWVRLTWFHLYTPWLLQQWLLPSSHGQARTLELQSGYGAVVAPHSHSPPPPLHSGLCTWDTRTEPSILHLTVHCLAAKWAQPEPRGPGFLLSTYERKFTSLQYIILLLPQSEKKSGNLKACYVQVVLLQQAPGVSCLQVFFFHACPRP
jgi:hypothetical protein